MSASSWIARELQRGLEEGAARMGRPPVLLQLVFLFFTMYSDRSIDGHEGQPEQPHIRIFVSFRDFCVFLFFSQGCKSLCVVQMALNIYISLSASEYLVCALLRLSLSESTPNVAHAHLVRLCFHM